MRFLILPFAMLAASAHAEPLTLTLTDAEKQEILSARTEADHAALDQLPRLSGRRVHGEIGFMVGTGGARGIYGATSVPLGDNGWASFGFENSRNLWPGRY